MAILRLDLEIDSEVYPELYQQLAAIMRPAARDERLRQLAANGLAWEAVRLYGTAVMLPPPLSPERKKPPRPAPPPAARKAAPRPPSQPQPTADFVDLAISAVPPEAPLNLAAVAAQLPVLVDVVEADLPQEEEKPAPEPAHEAAVQRPGARSRLLRMKERGLFKNG
jgi:hypothetical protein